jgi:hypothetical protein
MVLGRQSTSERAGRLLRLVIPKLRELRTHDPYENVEHYKTMSTSKKTVKAKAEAKFQDLKPAANPKGGGTLTLTGMKPLNDAAKLTFGPSSNPPPNSGGVVAGWNIETTKSS